MNPMKRYVLLAACVSLLAPSLKAEDIFVIATPLPQDVPYVREETTAFGQTIDVERLSERFTTTEEILRSASGANVRSIGGLGSFATVSLRGASASQCLVLVDGLRLNSPNGGGADLSKIPLDNVERIEIIRGSDSALFGEGALGGVVNIVTRDPGERPSGSLASTWGGYGAREYRVDVASPLWGPLGASLNLARRRADNDYVFENNAGTEFDPRDDFRDRRRNNAFDDTSLTAKLVYKDKGWDLRALANNYRADKELPGTITFPTPQAAQEIERDTCSLSAKARLGDRLRLAADLGQVEQDDTYTDPESNTTALSSSATLTRQAALNLLYRAEGLSFKPGCVYLSEKLDDLDVGGKARTTRSLVLRSDLVHDPVSLMATFRREDTTSFNPRWTYRAGVAWALPAGLTLKASLGEGYRLPSFYELYYDHGFFIGNQGLRPETSVSWDAGVDLDREYFGLQLNAFRHRYDDLIAYILQSGYYYRPYNISRACARGYEVYAWLEPWEGVRLSGNYTYNQMVDTTGEPNRDGNQIPGIPRNAANVQLDLSRTLCHVRLGLYASCSYTEGNFLTRANTKKLDNRRIVSAGLNLGLFKQFSLNLEVKNIFDTQISDLRGFPLEGRSAYVTLRMCL